MTTANLIYLRERQAKAALLSYAMETYPEWRDRRRRQVRLTLAVVAVLVVAVLMSF